MKTNPFTLVTAGLAAALITPALALEGPADDSPPPPAAETPAAEAPAMKPLRFDPPAAPKNLPEAPATAFLGVVTSDVPEMLADHLELKADEGIIVRSLMPDGPAAKAGIAVHDVIKRVGDTEVNSPADISKCISGQKPGDTVSVELIHKGKPAKLDITLGGRPAGVAAAEPMPMDQFNLEELPQDMAERVRKAIEGNLGMLDFKDADGGVQIPPHLQQALRGLQPPAIGGQPAPGNGGNFQMKSGGTLRIGDPQGSIEVKSNDGSKEVTIRDNQGRTTWTGPWDTEQDKAAAPADVRKRMESLNLDPDFKGPGLRLRMNQPAAPEDP